MFGSVYIKCLPSPVYPCSCVSSIEFAGAVSRTYLPQFTSNLPPSSVYPLSCVSSIEFYGDFNSLLVSRMYFALILLSAKGFEHNAHFIQASKHTIIFMSELLTNSG